MSWKYVGGCHTAYSVYMAGSCTNWHGPTIFHTAMIGHLMEVAVSGNFLVTVVVWLLLTGVLFNSGVILIYHLDHRLCNTMFYCFAV